MRPTARSSSLPRATCPRASTTASATRRPPPRVPARLTRRTVDALALRLLALALVLSSLLAPSLVRAQPPGTATAVVVTVPVPDVLRRDSSAAIDTIRGRRLLPVIRRATSTAPRGTVTGQQPDPGTRVRFGSRVVVTLSDGPAPASVVTAATGATDDVGVPPQLKPTVVVPDVVGQPVLAALLTLSLSRLSGTAGTSGGSTAGAVVVAQKPVAGTVVPRGSRVALQLRVPTDTLVPDLAGMDRTRARRAIRAAGLRAGAERDAYGTVTAGRVADQAPAPGTRVLLDATVDVTYSRGPQPVDSTAVVPDLAGMSAAAAARTLSLARLVLGASAVADDSTAVGLVIAQRPAAGTPVRVGTPVDVTVGRRPDPPPAVAVPDLLGLTRDDALAALDGNGLRLGGVRVRGVGTPGRVVAQSPVAGARVAPGSAVAVELAVVATAATGTAKPPAKPPAKPTAKPTAKPARDTVVRVPDVRGVDHSLALRRLANARLVAGSVDSLAVARGRVVGWMVERQQPPAESRVPIGTAVTLVLRARVVLGTVPALRDLALDSARAIAGAAGLRLAVGERRRSFVPRTVVASQVPLAGDTIPADSVVSVDLAVAPPWTVLGALAALLALVAGGLAWRAARRPPPAAPVITASAADDGPPEAELDAGDADLLGDELSFLRSAEVEEAVVVAGDASIIEREVVTHE